MSYDLRFQHPGSCIIAGCTQSGKTTLLLNILREVNSMFTLPSASMNIIYYYKQWQSAFEEFQKENIVSEWINEMPNTSSVKEKTTPYTTTGSIIVIDDFGVDIKKEVIEVFSILVHHTNSFVFLLNQNIFPKNTAFRDISLNTSYIILMKNPRDSSQISHFAKQFAPGNVSEVVKVFRDATKLPHSYLLFDLTQKTDDKLRLRSNILSTESPMKVWIPKNSNI